MAGDSKPPGGPFLLSADSYQKLMKLLEGGEVLLDPNQFEKITRFGATFYRLLPGALVNENSPGSGHQIALKIHSRTKDGETYAGVGPYGNLWDAKVAGDLTVVELEGRLSDPGNPEDAGWLALGVGQNLYLKGAIVEGDVDSASLEVGDSSPLVEFDEFTQTVFRVILARGESVAGKTVVVPMHEGELITFFDIINGKFAKYAR